MKVLVVDDNKNNRMILNLLLEEYQKNNKDICFEISEADDGLIAVESAKNNTYDLIFMDIMMPNMDGLTATASIRRIDKKAMIIAVSAVDDNDRKKVILNNGAEDYISKPINGDIFYARLHSYIKLIQARHSRLVPPKIKFNLFSKDICPYHIHFNGENEDMLSSFWEYYLLNNTPYNGISDMVRFIYDMGVAALKDGKPVDIYEENTEDYIYLTLVFQSDLDPDMIMHYADKNNFVENYKLEGKRLSAKLKKEKVLNFIEPSKKKDNQTINNKVEKTEKILETKVDAIKPAKVQNKIFDILDPEDFVDLKEGISKLNSLLLIVGSSSSIEVHEVDEMVATLLHISRTACSYNDLYVMGSSLGDLGSVINAYKDNFIHKSADLGPLAIAFGGDLSQWFKLLFVEGAPSIDFLDDSIVSNAKMIQSFINPESAATVDENVDDIFDF